jgi:hypothetical protein
MDSLSKLLVLFSGSFSYLSNRKFILWVDQMAFEKVVVDKTTLHGTDEGKLELTFFDAHTCHFAKNIKFVYARRTRVPSLL